MRNCNKDFFLDNSGSSKLVTLIKPEETINIDQHILI
nr:ALPV-161 [Albatrosspox virus]